MANDPKTRPTDPQQDDHRKVDDAESEAPIAIEFPVELGDADSQPT